jgi:hypothetical protein
MAWLAAKSFGRVLLAVLVAVAFVAGAQALGTFLEGTAAHWAWLPAWLSDTASWFGQAPPSNVNYQAIVAAALAVTGTLAGVYFATVAFVVSTTYKEATARVRGLVTRLPRGRVYAFLYVLAVLFGLMTLTLPLTGHQPNQLSLCLVTVLGGFVLLSFGRLRTQLYELLEPVGLLPIVQRDLARWTAQAARLVGRDPTGLRTRLSRERTRESLLALRDLCYLVRDRERKADNVPAEYAGTDPRTLSAARGVLSVWLRYARCKQVLIQLPGWCPQRARHKDWLLASDAEVGVALATATTLQPTATDDPLWVERHLAEIFGELVGGREVPQLASLLTALNDPVRMLVSCGMFAESRLWLQTVVSPAQKATMPEPRQPSVTGTTSDGSTQATTGFAPADTPGVQGHLYNLVDFVALTYTQAVLGLYEYVNALATDFPDWMIAQAHGTRARGLGPLPTALLRNLQDALRFEQAIEGHRVTSDANITQLVSRAIATEAFDEAMTLMAMFEKDFWPWTNYIAEGDPVVAGAALSRLDEALHKWDHPLSKLSVLFDQCAAVRRDVDDKWPNLSLDGLKARRAALLDQLRTPIARGATRVEVDLDPDRPDVFGWAFQRTHQDLLDDILSDRAPARPDLEDRLRSLVAATDRATSRLRETVQRDHARVLGSVWSEPTLMLLQLSGIALATGLAKRRSDVLDVFERVWGELLDSNAQRVLDAALAALFLDDALFGLSPGKMNRSRRDQQALAALNDSGITSNGLADGDLDTPSPASETKLAAMLRRVAFGHFEDVFVAAWVVPQAQRRGAVLPADLTRRLTDLIETFAEVAEDQRPGQAEPGAADSRDDGGEGTG